MELCEELITKIKQKIRAEFTNQLTMMHLDAIIEEAFEEVKNDHQLS